MEHRGQAPFVPFLSNFAMNFSLQMEKNVLLYIQELTQKYLKSKKYFYSLKIQFKYI